jgi:hypothetical protein
MMTPAEIADFRFENGRIGDRFFHEEARAHVYAPCEGRPFDAAALSSALRQVPDHWSAKTRRLDLALCGAVTPARAEQAGVVRRVLAASGGVAGAGLVSVPTSGPSGLSVEFSAASRKAQVDEFAELADCFLIDKKELRLKRLRRSIGFAARAHAVSEKGQRSDVPWMVTLTYRGDNRDWRSSHLLTAIKACRRWCQRRGYSMRYVWVAELQKRGVIHYHLCIWLPRGVRMPKWDVRASSRRDAAVWWPHGMTNRKVARHATAYLMKYMGKGVEDTFGQFPKGARIYGVGGLDLSLRRARRWLGLPAFVQANSDIWDKWARAPGGGWSDPDGVIYPSEFRRVKVGGFEALQRVCTHARAMTPSGPFSWLKPASEVH